METTVVEPTQARIDPSHVKGWGVDADPRNDPTYPMKKRNNGEHAGYSWERPPQQTETVEVLHSNERPNLSAVFGTSTPPAGVSGSIRRYAFKYSESSLAHWMPLMLADRIGSVEGILSDLAHGHIPNVFEEAGLKVQWKYNREKMVTGIVVGAALTSVALVYLSQRKNRYGR